MADLEARPLPSVTRNGLPSTWVVRRHAHEMGDESMRRFRLDPSCRLLLGTPAGIGTGLDLSMASTVLLLDPTWTPAATHQAIARADRLG